MTNVRAARWPLALTVVALASRGNAAPAPALQVESAPITDVTIFDGEAHVTRIAFVAVGDAERIAWPLLPKATDPDSVRVLVEDTQQVSLDTIELTRVGASATPPAPDGGLADQIVLADREEALISGLLAAVRAKPEVPEPPTRLDPRGWSRTLAFLGSMDTELTARLEAVAARKSALAARIAAPAAKAPEGLRVVAALRGKGAARLRLQYLVPGAWWRPRYEVRLDPAGEQVTVRLLGAVTQTTGEDWSGVRLAVSTASPAAAPELPRPGAWRIGSVERFVPRPIEERSSEAPTESSNASSSEPAGDAQIVGYVLDQNGMPLKGVKVAVRVEGQAVRAEGQAVRANARYSGNEGVFSFSGLSPGTYEVVATAPKLRTVRQEGVRVTSGRAAEVTLIMEIEGKTEEVKVVERAPLVSTTSATVKEVTDVEFLVDGFHADSLRSTLSSMSGVETSSGGMGADRTSRLVPSPPRPVDPSPAGPSAHALRFEALGSETVLSGAEQREVPLASFGFPALVERRVFPAHAPEARLSTTLVCNAPRSLPAGAATLFVGLDPAGVAPLPFLLPGARATLPLGVDPLVRPVRRLTQRTTEQGLLRRRDVTTFTVTTELANPHAHPIRARIQDQIPINRDGSVAVALVSSTPAAGLDAATGLLTWLVDVPPGKVATVRHVYTLERGRGHALHQ